MKMNIGFIGGGNLAEAVISGLTRAGEGHEIRVVERFNLERLAFLTDKYGIISANYEEVVSQSQVIIIAVKPNHVRDVLEQVTDLPLKGKLFISVAAGINVEFLEKYLHDAAVVRVMPNTSSAVQESVTGMVKGSAVTDLQLEMAAEVFRAVGQVLWIPEDKIDAVTAISGSGPAYYYLFTECLVNAGVKLGLNESEADLLARATIIGAAKMLANSDKPAKQLREEITSPNGTTQEALNVFREEGLEDIMMKATAACKRRSVEMATQYLK